MLNGEIVSETFNGFVYAVVYCTLFTIKLLGNLFVFFVLKKAEADDLFLSIGQIR